MNFIKFGVFALILMSLTCSPKPVLKQQVYYKISTPIYCGDINGDGKTSISDIMQLKYYLFNQGLQPVYDQLVGDVDCNNKVSLSDIVYLIKYCFKQGNPPCNPNGDSMCDCHT